LNRYLIYIDDELIDLYENTAIQISISNIEIGNLTQRNVSYTNTIQVPYTETNIRILSPLTVWSVSSKPYEKPTVKIVESGHQIFIGSAYVKIRGKSITLEMAESDVDIYELLKTKLVSESTFSGSIPFRDSEFYAIRNSTSGINAPVVNWGKLNNYPIQELDNGSFVGTMEPWTNEDTGGGRISWAYGTNDVDVTLGAGDDSAYLSNSNYIFFAGYKYRITVNFTTSSTSSIVTQLFFQGNGKTLLVIAGTVSSIGSQSIVYDYFSEEEYTGIKIVSSNTGGSSNVVTITDVTIASDYDSFIELKSPFYLPMYYYIDALKTSFAQFTQISPTDPITLDNFTAAQTAYMESLLIPYTRDEIKYADKFVELHRVVAQADGTQVITVTSTPIQFANLIKSDYTSGIWSLSNSLYSITTTPSGSFFEDFTLSLVINITSLAGGATVKARLEETGGTQYDSEVFTTTGIKQITLDTKVLSDTGYEITTSVQSYRALIVNNAGVGTMSVTVLSATLDINQVPVIQDSANEDVLYSAVLLPDITVYDLLKDFVVRTGSLTRFNGVSRTIETKPIENILSGVQTAKDWTSKRVKSFDDTIEFSLDGYAQTNYFQDKNEEENTIGKMSLDIINENIESESVYYESVMDTLIDEPVKGVNIANLKTFLKESATEFDSATAFSRPYVLSSEDTLSLIKIRDSVSSDPVVKFGTTTAATFKVGNYAPWTDFKGLFYGNLESALYQAKVVNHLYSLSSLDIETLDLWELIYDSGAYYMILNVDYSPGKLSKVKLLKTNTRQGQSIPPSDQIMLPGAGNLELHGIEPDVVVQDPS